MMDSFRSNGKLLLSGEYLVIKGALSLAVPLKLGQSLKVVDSDKDTIDWTTNINGKHWFSAEFDLPDFGIKKTTDKIISINLESILKAASLLARPNGANEKGSKVISEIEFPVEWGFGSSSTLISNIAYWFDIDPFDLYFNLFQGSGYDIACARSMNPLLYLLKNNQPEIENVKFNPSFNAYLYFVYLGKKQKSDESVKLFLQKAEVSEQMITRISEISKEMVLVNNKSDFGYLIKEHEEILSSVLNIDSLNNSLFSDFDGIVKSLGAWGGDFIMAVSNVEGEYCRDYFNKKGLQTVFKYSDIVLTSS